MSAIAISKPTADLVLAKAVLNASQQLGLTQTELAAVLGLHRTAISRLKQQLSLDPSSKQGELALLLVRLARALYAVTGGDESWIRYFMHHHNQMTGDIPAKQIQSIAGLVTVVQYLDAIRGKV